jgi:phosphatidate cytidylyltransferase
MDSALRNRLTFGPLMLLGLFAILWLDHWAQQRTVGILVGGQTMDRGVGGIGLCLLLLLLLPPATAELARLFTAESVRPYRLISVAGSAMLILHAFAQQFDYFRRIGTSSLAFIIVFVMLLTALRRAWTRRTDEAITHMAGTVLATLYLGGLAWFLVALRVKHATFADGSTRFSGTTFVVLMILLVVKFTDIGAFFGGRALGRHKLIRWLSPGKTWEGLAVGIAVAALIGMACAPLLSPLTWWKGAIFGALIGAVGQVGDLLESLMKRDAQVKDSGVLIPGFGGVLDVIDSPLLAAPFAYLLFSLF